MNQPTTALPLQPDPAGGALIQHETATAAAAAQARAEVEAAYIMADQRPRDWMQVRERLLRECERPGFCEAAKYSLPRRKWDPVTRQAETIYITGPTVRMAEAALRATRNVRVSTSVLYDDAEKRVCRVTAIDLEANTPLNQDFVIEKTVERKRLFDGQSALRERIGSNGDKVYIVASSESDVWQKQNAAAARARRNLILQLLPGDILDEAMARVDAVMRDEHARDPNVGIRKIVDAFRRIGVDASQLREYLGHSADTMTLAEYEELRSLGTAIKDGEATWEESLEAKKAEREGTAAAAPEKLSTEEKEERAEAIKYLAAQKIARPDAVAAALKGLDLPEDARFESLTLDALLALAAGVDTPATEAESTNDNEEAAGRGKED